ncbi:uncharacterized protein BX663DRAFT_439976 [Cokeromyces recurvatus]|uniref:uncharacterized protein n=1 Tax=Cokeromyces recurvatus TaxID=90255 RepID=UPI002220F9F8|nr:uncharacterized protein BX663DRAFT_439976 [Cokeromyces recurvatus]KAI7900094.1 hypothetical protein BX663DRAFT_439976 [Cokeromyces recurvatus]
MSSNNYNTSANDIPLLTTPFLHYIPTSPPSQELDFHLPSRTPLHGITVAEWAGLKSLRQPSNTNNNDNTNNTNNNDINISPCNKSIISKDSSEDDSNWKDVYRNIKCMDQLYDASFYSWLKSEENVLVTAMYLHRIANEYPLVRIINALKWLISDWRLESISDLRRAHLLCHLTHSWAIQYTTTLITMVLSSAPYTTADSIQRERFLRAFTKDWDFSKLSEFFMYLQSPANIDYKVKCVMLQEAARRERETLGAKILRKKKMNSNHCIASTSSNNRRHHRRTSSNDVNDIKRLRLSTPDLDHSDNESNISTSTNTMTNTATTTTTPNNLRRSASPDLRNTSNPGNELSHLHLSDDTTEQPDPIPSNEMFMNTTTSSCCYPSNSTTTGSTTQLARHLRRRRSSSSSGSTIVESDIMTVDDSNNRKKGGPSSLQSHFTEETI